MIMAEIRERKVGANSYYYLEHSFRLEGKIVKKDMYLGKQIPKNIDSIKAEFLFEIYNEKWYSLFSKIKANYKKDMKSATPTEREQELEQFMIKFTYDTQRIEGSTLNYKETADLLQHGITPANRPSKDVREAETHSKIFYEMLDYKGDLNPQLVLEWHYKLFRDTKPDIAGEIRTRQVYIARTAFIPPAPALVQAELTGFFKWYNKSKGKLNPVELAALVHLKFVTIHPFRDGNGRVSRLLMNFVLNKHGYPMLNIPYKNRAGYYNALERAQVKKNNMIFASWVFRRYVKVYRRYAK
jgi:Fic family protein